MRVGRLFIILLLTYGLLAADRDAYSFLSFISTYIPGYKLLTRGLFLIVFVFCVGIFFKRFNTYPKLIQRSVGVSLLIVLFVVFGSLVKGHDLVTSLSYAVYSGLPVYVIWVSVGVKENHLKLFFVFVFLQLLLSFFVITVPGFDFLDGMNYKIQEGFNVGSAGQSSYTFFGDGFNKYALARYAQFHNPNALGLYAAIALAISLSLYLNSSLKLKSVGWGMFFLGAYGWLYSLTRAPIIFLIVAVFFILGSDISASLKKGRISKGNALVLPVIFVVLLGMWVGGVFDYLITDRNDVSVESRLSGYESGFDAIARFPVFGIDKNWVWEDVYPHFLSLALAAEHGVLVGVLITILFFFGSLKIVVEGVANLRSDGVKRYGAILAILLVFVCLGIAVTNNLAAPVIFWIAFAEATLLVSKNGVKQI